MIRLANRHILSMKTIDACYIAIFCLKLNTGVTARNVRVCSYEPFITHFFENNNFFKKVSLVL